MFRVAIVLGGCWLALAGPAAASQPKSIWEQETLTGDWGGARSALKDRGVDVLMTYIGEVFDVLSGGLARRASYEGRFDLTVDADLDKLLGWKGASAGFTVFQIHSSSRNVGENVGSLAGPSNIDALQTTRLFSAWVQQNFFDDRVSLRVGQLGFDAESFTSATGGGLINGTFGWATVLGANMTSGGPAYPLAAPGARLAIKPTDDITLIGAILSGDPAGPNCNDLPQVCNRYGLTFSFSGGALLMGEVQYAVNAGKQAKGLPGIYKAGYWHETASFPDQQFPALRHDGNWGVYGIADQMVWRGAASSLNLFVRAGMSPSDRNLISWYVDGGFGIKGLIAARPDDVLTFGAAYQKISADAVAADRAAGLAVVRSNEVVFELSYQAQLAPWWVLQPDIQYIVHPGGNVPHPDNPLVPVKNATVIGLRSTMKF
jgi:porin